MPFLTCHATASILLPLDGGGLRAKRGIFRFRWLGLSKQQGRKFITRPFSGVHTYIHRSPVVVQEPKVGFSGLDDVRLSKKQGLGRKFITRPFAGRWPCSLSDGGGSRAKRRIFRSRWCEIVGNKDVSSLLGLFQETTCSHIDKYTMIRSRLP